VVLRGKSSEVADASARAARNADIVEVARRHGVLENLSKSGVEWVEPCPVCGGQDRFSINPEKPSEHYGSRGVFNCRQCGAGGDVIDFEKFLTGASFGEAVLALEEIEELEAIEREEADPAAAEAKALRDRRRELFVAEKIDFIVGTLDPIISSPGASYLSDVRSIDIDLPAVRDALERVGGLGWHPRLYFSAPNPDEPHHELHKQLLSGIVGVLIDPITHAPVGSISRTFLYDGRKVGSARILRRADAGEGLVCVRDATGGKRSAAAIGEGVENCLAAIELEAMGVLDLDGASVWSAGSHVVMPKLTRFPDAAYLFALADNDPPEKRAGEGNRAKKRSRAKRPWHARHGYMAGADATEEMGVGELAARKMLDRWAASGRGSELLIPEDAGTDWNDVLARVKGEEEDDR
jgi:Zinc-binding domain of primase-helicase